MKSLFATVLPLSLLLFIIPGRTIEPLPLGSAIPESSVKMKDVSGKEISFSDAKKKNGLLVMFTCNTCPYVVKNQQRTREVCTKAITAGIGIALVNSNEGNRADDDSYAAMKEYAREQKYNWYYLLDDKSTMANSFGASRTPECFLFNADGKLVYHGAIDDNPGNESGVTRHHLVAAMDEMLAGKPVSVSQSRSVGCGIKRAE